MNLSTDCVNQLSLIILFTQSLIITHLILEHSITRITFISVCFMQLFLLFQAPGDLEIEFESYYASRFLIIFLILNFRLFF